MKLKGETKEMIEVFLLIAGLLLLHFWLQSRTEPIWNGADFITTGEH